MKTNVGKLILEHLKEHREKVGNRSNTIVSNLQYSNQEISDLLFPAQDGCETADLSAEGSADVLGWVGDKILHGSHDLIKQRVPVNETAET